MTAVTAGSSCSKHSTKRDVGSGSSEHVFWEDCKIVFLTHCSDTGSKRCKEDWVYGPSVGRIGTGISLSSSSRFVFTFRMK